MKGKFLGLPGSITINNIIPDGPNVIPEGIFGPGTQGDVTYNNGIFTLNQDLDCENLWIGTGTNYTALRPGWDAANNRPVRIRVSNTLYFSRVGVLDCRGLGYPLGDISGGSSAGYDTYIGRPGAACGGGDGGDGYNTPNLGPGTPGDDWSTYPSIGSIGQWSMSPLPSSVQGSSGSAPGGAINFVVLNTLDQISSGLYGGLPIVGGSGGGGGGSGNSGWTSGGGGGGGGIAHVLAKNIVCHNYVNTSRAIIDVTGGVGGNPGGLNPQSGGAGGNGGMLIVTEDMDPTILLRAYRDPADGGGTTLPNSGQTWADQGHIYLASKHTNGAYIYKIRGYYHPITLV